MTGEVEVVEAIRVVGVIDEVVWVVGTLRYPGRLPVVALNHPW